jgi:hypothetical protein
LRLEHPSWSILTVVVMMNSQFVGSITVKAILRVSGTLCFREGDCRRPFPSLRDALAKLDQGLEWIRDSRLLADQKLDVVMHTLELANRYQAIAEALEECSGALQTLELERYLGDYAL